MAQQYLLPRHVWGTELHEGAESLEEHATPSETPEGVLWGRWNIPVVPPGPPSDGWRLGQNLGWPSHVAAVFQSAAMAIDESA